MSAFNITPFTGMETRRNLILNPPIIFSVPPGIGPNVTTSNYGGRTLITHTLAAPAGDAFFTMPTTPLLAATTYSALVHVAAVGGTVLAPSMSVYDGVTFLHALTVTFENDQWVGRGTVTLVGVPADPRIIVHLDGPGTGESVIAWANLEQGSIVPATLFDGSETDTGSALYSWAGTAYASASILTTPTTAETLTPLMVFGPFESARAVRTITRELLHSREVRSTYVPTTYRYGYFQLLFTSHSEARAAMVWFSAYTLFTYAGPVETLGGGYALDDDLYVIVGQPILDASFNTTFIVTGDDLTITQNGRRWELRVPYKEVSL